MVAAFIVGIGVGLVAAIVGGFAVLRAPTRHDDESLITYGAIGNGPVRTSGPQTLYDALQQRLN